MNESSLHYRTFIVLLVIVSLAFTAIMLPYYGAVFWAAVFAISFAPMHRWIQARMPRHRNAAAMLTLLTCLFIVILPLILLAASLIREGTNLYKRMESGRFNLGAYAQQVLDAMPPRVHELLNHFELADMFSIQQKLSDAALQGSKFLAGQAVHIGQNTFQFLIALAIMLYLLFFLLRDGPFLGRRINALVPLDEQHKVLLIRKFITVVRATIKGNLVVAATQGALGGLIFWILGIEGALFWGTAMAFLSLLPAIGSAIIWFPVAVYFFVTGALADGIILSLYGVLVIGLVDNVLRPLLVGKDTKIPDYVVLISTLGGLAAFGINGFVIGPLIAALFMATWDLFPSATQARLDDPE